MTHREITINGQQIKLIPLGDCACGCGEKTPISQRNHASLGYIKGQPHKWASHGHWRRGCVSNWKGGEKYHDGYILKLAKGHNRANRGGYVRKHILEAEKVLGKPLPPGAVVHHANGSKNSGQLVICENSAYHSFLHKRTRAYNACGHANWLKCPYCKEYDDPANLYCYINQNRTVRGYHEDCYNLLRKERRHAKK